MINTLLGFKKGMVSSYDSRGRRVGATLIEIAPNFVTQIKTSDGKDGYSGVQLGVGEKRSVRKPQIGHLKKAGIEKKVRWMREVKSIDRVEPGQEITLDQVFKKGDAVKVSGISKGRGFQGGVKRYNFAGGPKTHGQSDRHRAPGSIGQGTTPGRVYKGKRMAGHMGVDQVSYRGLEVISVSKGDNLLTIKGGVPGPVGGLVILQNIGRIRGYTPPPEEKEDEEADQETQNSNSSESADSEAPDSMQTSEETEPVKGEENAGS